MVGYNQYHCPNCGQFVTVVHIRGDPPKVKLWCDPCGEEWTEDDKGKASRPL